LNNDFTELYNENGYVVLKNKIPRSRIDSLLENIFKLYCKYSNGSDDFQGIQDPWNTELFHRKLIEFRKTNPEDFGAIYDSLKTSLPLTQLVTDDNVVDNVARSLQIKPSDLSISEPMCRLDVPSDQRNAFDWHQDRSYFPQNRDGLHGLVCWIPLTDITEEMGAIHISPKSHLEGNLKLAQKSKQDSLHSTQIPVPNEFVKKYEDVIVQSNVGDLVLFNMLVFHRSGKNTSNQVRLTIQARFHTSTADDFIPFELNNYYNPYIKHKLEEKYDCSDIPNNKRQPPVARYGG